MLRDTYLYDCRNPQAPSAGVGTTNGGERLGSDLMPQPATNDNPHIS